MQKYVYVKKLNIAISSGRRSRACIIIEAVPCRPARAAIRNVLRVLRTLILAEPPAEHDETAGGVVPV